MQLCHQGREDFRHGGRVGLCVLLHLGTHVRALSLFVKLLIPGAYTASLLDLCVQCVSGSGLHCHGCRSSIHFGSPPTFSTIYLSLADSFFFFVIRARTGPLPDGHRHLCRVTKITDVHSNEASCGHARFGFSAIVEGGGPSAAVDCIHATRGNTFRFGHDGATQPVHTRS
jgi:hypothetical protein